MERKPKFSDIIGALVASVAHARSVADAEALRIAHRYHRNELLKGLPIPRLRLQRVSVSLPVIVDEIVPGTSAEQGATTDILDAAVNALKSIITELSNHLDEMDKMENPSDEERRSNGRYRRILDAAQNRDPKAVDLFKLRFADDLEQAFAELNVTQGDFALSDALIRNAAGESTDRALRAVLKEVGFRYVRARIEEERQEGKEGQAQDPFDPDKARNGVEKILGGALIERIFTSVRHAAEDVAVSKPTVAPDFHVLVDTDSIKSAGGGPDAVTRLNLVMFEEGLEWMTETRDGAETSRLMVE